LNRTCIIINPAARGAKARLARLQKIAKDVVIKATTGPGDAEAQAERAVEQGYKTIVAAGGDGTINEVVNGIGIAPVSLGILPMGTVNVFAMELGIPFGVEEAWKIVRARHVRAIDLASANGHFFVQMAGIGFDAQVAKENNRTMKKMIGPLSYVLTTAKLSMSRPPRLRAITQGRVVAEGSFVLVGNGRFYGGPFSVFQGANSGDGLLHVLVFRGSDPVSILRYWRGAMFGTVASFSDVHYFKAKNLLVEADREVPLEVDGEVAGHSPVKFAIKHKKLHVLAPAARDH
jgi:diacylglycerol kinase (ATP)